MPTESNKSLGVALNVVASVFFALMFAYTPLLGALDGGEIYGWRMLLTFPCLTLFILIRGYGAYVASVYRRLRTERYFWVTRLLGSGLLSLQLWLFMWAPVNGQGLAVSLGYFLMPITMVVVGRLAFRDRLSRWQQLASLFALAGALNQLLISQALAWPTLVVCLGYPIYFWLRRMTDTNHIGGLWFDMLLALPASIYFIVQGGGVVGAPTVASIALILGLGLLSALALVLQALSAPLLNLSLFGLLVYVEPLLLFIVALCLGEMVASGEWPTYVAIWLAVVALCVDGVLRMHQARGVARAAG